jgi:arylsulfatase
VAERLSPNKINRRGFLRTIGASAAAVILPGCTNVLNYSNSRKPNIIIIMTDDMGFSDLGCYGSEIETSNLDRLAKDGIRFTQFYNTARCCPTRASLLTGLYPHQAGVGAMTKDLGPDNPGYRGRLMPRCVTIAEVLRTSGYRSFQTGKWHVGDRKKSWWPLARGFDRSYGCPQGGGFYFHPSASPNERSVVLDNDVLYTKQKDPPKDWYTTDAWTQEGIKFMRQAVEMKKPFFWYLAHNAPHWPLQAKPQDITKYRGKYKLGWDAIRQQRYDRLIKMGIIDKNWKLSPRGDNIPAWDSLSAQAKDEQDFMMATYAAMIDCVDQNVGKIIKTLKETGVYDNTLILFLQDNGGCAEGGIIGKNQTEAICGTAESFVKYGQSWANVSNTPFRKYKHWVHEGGTATPLIAHWPAGISDKLNGSFICEPTHVIDLMATCVDLSSAKYPRTYKGNKIIPMQGKSLRPIFEGKSFKRNEPIFFEHGGNRAVRKGKWKLVSAKGKKWELYDMQADRTELNDLAEAMPEKLNELSALYDAWSKRCFVNKTKIKRKPKPKG